MTQLTSPPPCVTQMIYGGQLVPFSAASFQRAPVTLTAALRETLATFVREQTCLAKISVVDGHYVYYR